MANLTRQRSVIAPEYPEIVEVFASIPGGTRISKKEVYETYCRNCEGEPMSDRTFWPRAKKCMRLRELRTATGRYIIKED